MTKREILPNTWQRSNVDFPIGLKTDEINLYSVICPNLSS